MKGRKWTSEEEMILRKMTLQGYSTCEIACELGRSKFAVYSRREKLIDQEKQVFGEVISHSTREDI